MFNWGTRVGLTICVTWAMTGLAYAQTQVTTYPNAGNTGVPPGTTLTTISSANLSTAGQILDGKLVTGDVVVSANNVIIRNSEIRGRVWNTSGSYTIQDSTVGPT